MVDGQQVWIWIWIYCFDASDWCLRAVSSLGASVVWRERFASDVLALQAYERTFSLLRKYAGLWPAHSMLGHVITGYLYKGDPPTWPHAVQGIPGAPTNIVMEFTVPAQHIEDHVVHSMGLRKTLPKTGDWWR